MNMLIPFGTYTKIDDLKKAIEEKRPFRLTEEIDLVIGTILEDTQADLIVFVGVHKGIKVKGVYYIREGGWVSIQDQGAE